MVNFQVLKIIRPFRPSLLISELHLNIPIPLTLPFLGTALYAQMPAAYNVPQFDFKVSNDIPHFLAYLFRILIFLVQKWDFFKLFQRN